MLKLCFYLLTAIFLCSCNPSAAQDLPGNGLTTLIEGCLENNPELKSSFHHWKAAKSSVVYKTAISDPVVNFRHNIEPVQTRTGEQNQVLTLSQKLPFPGKQKIAIRLNNQLSQNEKLAYEAKFRDLITEIKKSYAEIWFLSQAIEATEINNKLVEFIANEGSSNLSSMTLMPILKAQSQLAQSANDLLNYSELLAAEKAKMTSLTGLVNLSDDWFKEIPSLLIPDNDQELLELALKNRIEIQTAKNRTKISATRLRLASFENKPDFTIGFSQSFTGSRPDLNKVYLKDEGMDPIGFFVQLNLPIWGNKNRSRIKEANEKRTEAQASMLGEETKTRANFVSLWLNLANRKRLHQLYQQTILPQAQKAADTAQSTFQSDNKKFSDYLEAMTTVYALKIAAYRAEADFFNSASELEKFTGTPFSVIPGENPK